MNIIFMGTPEFAVECLDVLVKSNHNILAVVTSEDKPAGRGQKIKISEIKKYSITKNIKTLQPKNLKDPSFLNEIKLLKPDIFIVVAFRMLPKILWEIPKKGTINLHASLLPNLRGAAPIHWAIINGLQKTGVSTFYINENIDCGEIIEQKKVSISENENTGELYNKLKKIGALTILSTLEKIDEKDFKSIKQNESKENLKAPKLNRENTKIDWNKPSNEIHDFIRGLNPFPSAWTSITENKKILKIYKSRRYSSIINEKQKPGTIIMNKNILLISTSSGLIEILELKMEGKKMMNNIEFNNGFKSLNKTILS
ncbi:MAG: methionyl-tRNA formyltransferase [Flavobacteriaceae bacterium]|nr:methionyl-tRNA formyltransferase [Flavobacteriaceae bacterium]MBT5392469.1 methionyl-tRNA formyltransferase [Flavobacteriaceae bacterium]MBT7573742.1 methionyl-tRNA formyltransferase [Flavobacteriaceae bacterium]MDB4024449.1 methionyl-tRNA formyltransferase [Flavobacteriaceae bacterium]MDB4131569.1 methionyl-tRNA formyltransferase [Flavobacteriaceae bacterium]